MYGWSLPCQDRGGGEALSHVYRGRVTSGIAREETAWAEILLSHTLYNVAISRSLSHTSTLTCSQSGHKHNSITHSDLFHTHTHSLCHGSTQPKVSFTHYVTQSHLHTLHTLAQPPHTLTHSFCHSPLRLILSLNTLTPALDHTLTHSLFHSFSHTGPRSHPYTLTLPLILSHRPSITPLHTHALFHSFSHTGPRSHPYTLDHSSTHSLTPALNHTLTHSLFHSFSHTGPRSHPYTLTLPLILSHNALTPLHTHSSTHSLTQRPHTPTHSLFHSFSHTTPSHPHTFTLPLTHTLNTLTPPHTHSSTLTGNMGTYLFSSSESLSSLVMLPSPGLMGT